MRQFPVREHKHTRARTRVWVVVQRNVPPPKREDWRPRFSRTYIMTLASSLNSSSDMHSSRIIFTATFFLFHLPSNTSPNWPEPNSWPRVSSAGFISHWSVGRKGHEGRIAENIKCLTLNGLSSGFNKCVNVLWSINIIYYLSLAIIVIVIIWNRLTITSLSSSSNHPFLALVVLQWIVSL